MRKSLIAAGFLMLFVLSCDRTRTSTGWDYMPDMYYSEAYETNAPNEHFADGMTMRTPVAGTVPREMVPFAYEKSDEDRLLAGKELVNPLTADDAVVVRGGELYRVFCVSCHGDQGDGQGFLYTSGRYPYPPASLVTEAMEGYPDGELYHAITVGFGVMGQHGSMIGQDDRWKIIHYIRQELQQ